MKQVTVTLPESLERQLDAYLETHPESAANVMQTALKAFLEEQMWARLELSKPARELDLPTFDGEVDADASINHDAYTSEHD